MSSILNNLHVIEKGDKIILYSLENQAWLRADKKYIQSCEKENLYSILRKYHLVLDQELVAHKKKGAYTLYIFLTRKCNMVCSFCSMNAGPSVDIKNEISLGETIGFLERIKDYCIKRIVISGGEPLLSIKLYSIISYISEEMKNTEIIVQTNGTIINETFCEEMKGKIDRLNISIESIYDIWVDKRNDIIERLKIVKQYGIKMEFSFVVTKKNQNYIFDYLELCRQFNAEAGIKIVSAIGGEKRFDDLSLNSMDILNFYKGVIGFIIRNKYTSDANLLTILGYQPIPRQGCSAYSLKSFSLMPEGDISRCHSLKRKKYNYIGNVRDQDILYCLENSFEKHENNFAVNNKIYCKMCMYKHFCTGICSAEVYNCFENTFYKPDNCEWRKILIEYYLWEHNSREKSNIWQSIYNKIISRLEDINEEG